MHPIARKLIIFVATLWAAVTVNFFIPRLMPGTPADAALAKLAGTGPGSPAEEEAIADTVGVRARRPWTCVLVSSTAVRAFVVDTLVGVWATWRRGRVTDAVATVGSTFTS